MFLDIGASPEHNSEQRFEVVGADAAVKHLQQYGIADTDTHEVWTAIALHTSGGIAERISELALLVRIAVVLDFGRFASIYHLNQSQFGFGKAGTVAFWMNYKHEIQKSLPLLYIATVLGDAVVEQALQKQAKPPPASWPGVLLRAKLRAPDWTQVDPVFRTFKYKGAGKK